MDASVSGLGSVGQNQQAASDKKNVNTYNPRFGGFNAGLSAQDKSDSKLDTFMNETGLNCLKLASKAKGGEGKLTFYDVSIGAKDNGNGMVKRLQDYFSQFAQVSASGEKFMEPKDVTAYLNATADGTVDPKISEDGKGFVEQKREDTSLLGKAKQVLTDFGNDVVSIGGAYKDIPLAAKSEQDKNNQLKDILR
jgi:hypothetical protein